MKNDPYVVAAFLKAKEAENWAADGTNPIVTIARQVGAMGEEIAYRASNILTEMSHGKLPWVVVDKDLVNVSSNVITCLNGLAAFFPANKSSHSRTISKACWAFQCPARQ
jgi:hypothetical protein